MKKNTLLIFVFVLLSLCSLGFTNENINLSVKPDVRCSAKSVVEKLAALSDIELKQTYDNKIINISGQVRQKLFTDDGSIMVELDTKRELLTKSLYSVIAHISFSDEKEFSKAKKLNVNDFVTFEGIGKCIFSPPSSNGKVMRILGLSKSKIID